MTTFLAFTTGLLLGLLVYTYLGASRLVDENEELKTQLKEANGVED